MDQHDLDALDALLKVLLAHNVRSARLGDMSFEFAPPAQKLALTPDELHAQMLQRKREADELLYGSSGA